MGRARLLRPEFFLHEGLGALSPLHRLLFAGLWTLADREGRLEDRPMRIKIQILPWDDCNVAAMLTDLAKVGSVVRYQADGKAYISIPSFLEYQKPHLRELPSTIPAPSEKQAQPRQTRTKKHENPGDAEHLPRWPVSVSKTVSDPETVNTHVAAAPPSVSEQEVFDHWRNCCGHPEARLDPKRLRLIRAAMKLGYDGEQLKIAIAGCASSSFHMGQNDRKRRFDALELILRDADHIDQFISLRMTPAEKQAYFAQKLQPDPKREAV